MNKSIFIKLGILLGVTILVYSIFWFFKIGQVEKKINNFISENSLYVSAGEVTVSGFPLSQKIAIKDLKFTIPGSIATSNQIVVKHLEATAGIFSSDYTVTIEKNAIAIQNHDDASHVNVVYNKEPEVTFSIGDSGFSKASYHDFGYKILGSDGKVAYAASASVANFEAVAEGEKLVNKINVDIREIEGFDVMDVYKNSLEKKINDGLRTGEITLGNASVTSASVTTSSPTIPAAPSDPQAALNAINSQAAAAQTSLQATQATIGNMANQTNPMPAKGSAAAVAKAIAAVESPKAGLNVSDNTTAVSSSNAVPGVPSDNQVAVTPGVPSPNAQVAATPGVTSPASVSSAAPTDAANPTVASTTVVDVTPQKSNFMLTMEYSVTSSSDNQVAVPLDPSKMQDVGTTQYSKDIKISNLEFSNPLYKIMVNGELKSFQDDNMLSGSIAVKVEKIDNLIAALSKGLNKINDDKKAAVAQNNPSSGSSLVLPTTDDPYNTFLTKIVANLAPVSKELAAKNAVTKEDIAAFDIRREKNLEVLVNETSLREVLGKF